MQTEGGGRRGSSISATAPSVGVQTGGSASSISTTASVGTAASDACEQCVPDNINHLIILVISPETRQ